jgi:hypothetical protein
MNQDKKDAPIFQSPRPYLSWSQIQLFERDPVLYAKKYIYGEEEAATDSMRLGKKLALVLEHREATGDGALDNLVSSFPSYPDRELGIEANMDGVDVPLYGVLDGFDTASLRIGEYKSGKLWTQEMVDQSGQLKMYALIVWLKYKRMPSEIKLHWARTQYDESGQLGFVGEIQSFAANITLEDILLFSERVRAVWAGIKELCGQRYQNKLDEL